MEKQASSKYPEDFRFCPTNEDQLIVYSLQNKVDSQELLSDVIRETNLYDRNPVEVIDMFDSWGEFVAAPIEAAVIQVKEDGDDMEIIEKINLQIVPLESGRQNHNSGNHITDNGSPYPSVPELNHNEEFQRFILQMEFLERNMAAIDYSSPGQNQSLLFSEILEAVTLPKFDVCNNAEKAALVPVVRKFAAAPAPIVQVEEEEEDTGTIEKMNQEIDPLEFERQEDHNSVNHDEEFQRFILHMEFRKKSGNMAAIDYSSPGQNQSLVFSPVPELVTLLKLDVCNNAEKVALVPRVRKFAAALAPIVQVEEEEVDTGTIEKMNQEIDPLEFERQEDHNSVNYDEEFQRFILQMEFGKKSGNMAAIDYNSLGQNQAAVVVL